MPWHQLIWTDYAMEKIAAHDVNEDEVEQVVLAARCSGTSRSTGLPIYTGLTAAGRPLVVVFKWMDERRVAIEIVTAYEPER